MSQCRYNNCDWTSDFSRNQVNHRLVAAHVSCSFCQCITNQYICTVTGKGFKSENSRHRTNRNRVSARASTRATQGLNTPRQGPGSSYRVHGAFPRWDADDSLSLPGIFRSLCYPRPLSLHPHTPELPPPATQLSLGLGTSLLPVRDVPLTATSGWSYGRHRLAVLLVPAFPLDLSSPDSRVS